MLTAKEVQEIDAHLLHLGEWVGTENELDHEQGLAALNAAWKLTADLRASRSIIDALRAKLKVAHEALRPHFLHSYGPDKWCQCSNATRVWEEDQPERHAPTCPAAPDWCEKEIV